VAAQAAAALDALPGRDLLVASSAREFAESALRLMNDAVLRAELSQRGRAYVEQHHDWQAVTNRLVDVYQQALVAHTREKGGIENASPVMSGKVFFQV